jgi:hypothetical protein
MKATIEGKTYNTETATCIAKDGYPGSVTDFQNWVEHLYVTAKGSYFLYGSGGPMSKYAEPCGNNSMGGGSKIIPMTKAEALAWCEEHECEDAIEKHFADMVTEA